jgi:hypothetical protein
VAKESKVFLQKKCGNLIYDMVFDSMPEFPYTVKAELGFLMTLTENDIVNEQPSIYTSNPPRAV